jgi:hypothetical protein
VNSPKLLAALRYLGLMLAAVLLLILLAFGILRFLDRKALRNVALCERMKPGITVDSLVGILTGAKFQQAYAENWVSFDAPFGSSDSIDARYDSTSRRVLELNCGTESGPLWKISP